MRDYYDRVNSDLLALIPYDAWTVLEIGCGAGALAAAYRRRNPAVRWIGIEMDLAAFSVAETRMSRCYHGAVEQFEGCLRYMISAPDVLIFGDVIEHLVDPWRVLTWLAELAAPEAQVLACVPNVGHWTVIRDLMAGKWEYQSEGLLDRTHLRFFTRQSIEQMFRGAGLSVFETRGRDIANAGYDDFAAELTFEPPKELRAYQYLVRAVKGDPPKPLHIHAITSQTVCVPVRIDQPLAALATVPGVRCFVTDSGGPELVFPPDTDVILILQRLAEEPARYVETIRRLIDTYPRLVVVYEIDDDPESAPGIVASDYLPLRLCHAVQCSTPVVAETVARWNGTVAVFPNQIAELPEWEKKTHAGVRLFFGAVNREESWAPIMPALNRVLRDHQIAWFDVVGDRAFFEALECSAKGFTPLCPYPEYLRVLRAADIALLPLEPTRFNRHKSDLKFLECAANGVVAMASEVDGLRGGPYYRPIADPAGCSRGILYTAQGFEDRLRGILVSPGLRRDMAEAAYAYVKQERLLGQHYRARLEWYRRLLGTRAALDAALRGRCPELASSPGPALP